MRDCHGGYHPHGFDTFSISHGIFFLSFANSQDVHSNAGGDMYHIGKDPILGIGTHRLVYAGRRIDRYEVIRHTMNAALKCLQWSMAPS